MSSYIDVSTWTITSCNAKHISLLLKLQSSLSIKKAITSQKAPTCHGACSTQTKRWISIDDPPTKAPRETGQRRNTLLMGQSLPDVSTSSSHLILCEHQPASQRWRTNSHILSSPLLTSAHSNLVRGPISGQSHSLPFTTAGPTATARGGSSAS